MNCTDAQLDLQRRLDADSAEGARGFADLDAHLAGCPACARVWLDLLAVRQRLAVLRTDAPTSEEMNTMWQAIAATAPLELPAFRPPARAVIIRFVGASAAVAACLFLAFVLGEQRYGARLTERSVAVSLLSPRATEGWQPSEATATSSNGMAWQYNFGDFQVGTPNVAGGEATTQRLAEAGTFRYRAGYEVKGLPALQPTTQMPAGAAEPRADLLGRGLGGGTASVERYSRETTERISDQAPQLTSPAMRRGRSYFDDRDAQLGASVAFEAIGTSRLDNKALTDLTPPASQSETYAGESLNFYSSVNRGETAQSTDWALTSEEDLLADAARARFQRQWDMDGLTDKAASATVHRYNLAPAQVESTSSQRTQAVDAVDTSANVEDLDRVFLTDRESRLDRWHAGTQLADASADQNQLQAAMPSEAPGQPAAADPPNGAPLPAPTARPAKTKIIKTGSLATEVEDYEAAVQQVDGILARFDCYLADASTKESAGGALVGVLAIRVAPADFEALFAALRDVGRLTSEDVRSADVTAQYVDLEARIAALKITEARLVELVKSKSFVDRMDDLLKVEQEMNRVRTEIEQFEGQLRVLADRVALSTITLALREPARTVPAASLAVEVAELDKAADALADAVAGLDGRLVSGKVSERAQGALAGEYRLKVNLNRFGDTLTAIAALGRVDTREVRDWNAASADAPWAARVPCDIALTLFERARDLPGGSVTVQIGTLPDAIEQLTEAIDPLGASIAANRTTQRDDGSASADVQIRVPAGAFAQVVERVESLGRVIAKQLTGETGRILGGSADTPCTLTLTLSEPQRQIPSGGMIIEVEKFAPARDRLAKLVADRKIQVLASSSSQRTDGTWVGRFNLGITASAMDAAVSELEKLGEVAQREIRGIGLGELSRIDPNALGLIQVVLAEKAALTPEPDRAGGSFRKYLRDGLAGLYESLGLIVYGLVVLAPWLVIALGAGSLVTRVWKRRRARATEPRL